MSDPAATDDHSQRTRHLPLPRFVPLPNCSRRPEQERLARAAAFYQDVNRRRTTRHFSDEAVPRRRIEHALSTPGTVPSGASRD